VEEVAMDGGELTGRLHPKGDHIDRLPSMGSGGEDAVGDALGRDRGSVGDERQPGPLLLEVGDGACDLGCVRSAELDLHDVADAVGLVEEDDGELVGAFVHDGPLECGDAVAEAEQGRVVLDAGGQPGAGEGEGVV
jgi:hypothetical protein